MPSGTGLEASFQTVISGRTTDQSNNNNKPKDFVLKVYKTIPCFHSQFSKPFTHSVKSDK